MLDGQRALRLWLELIALSELLIFDPRQMGVGCRWKYDSTKDGRIM